MKIHGFITVRTGSSRLPGKCLLKFGEVNVLEHVIRRTHFFGLQPVVCTTTLPEDNIIEEIAQKEGCLVYRGSVKDKLQRWSSACDKFNIESFHTVDCDDPFFDGELGKRSFQMLRKGFDIIYPASSIYIGGVGYSLTSDIIKRACTLKKSDDTEMMWYYIEKVPGVRKAELPVPGARTATIRLTLDYEEDYWMLLTVLRILGPRATWKEIQDLFVRNPDLHQVNWFRNAQWKKGQEDRGKEVKV